MIKFRNKQNRKSELLPYPVIAAASGGDVKAINTVLKYYEGYINALSTRKLYDRNGSRYLFIDEDLRRELETKLITKILDFDTEYLSVA